MFKAGQLLTGPIRKKIIVFQTETPPDTQRYIRTNATSLSQDSQSYDKQNTQHLIHPAYTEEHNKRLCRQESEPNIPRFRQQPLIRPDLANQMHQTRPRIAPSPIVPPGQVSQPWGANQPSAIQSLRQVACHPLTASQLGQHPQSIVRDYKLSSLQYKNGYYELSGTDQQSLDLAAQTLTQWITTNQSQYTVWNYLDDTGIYMPYDQMECLSLEHAYLSGQKDLTFTKNGNQYRMIFGFPHIQCGTDGSVAVFRMSQDYLDVVSNPMPGDVTWYWENGENDYKPYNSLESRQIEASLLMKMRSTLFIGENKSLYKIDLVNFTQLKVLSGYQRRIFREN